MAAIATEKKDAIVRVRVFIDLEPPGPRGTVVTSGAVLSRRCIARGSSHPRDCKERTAA
jgi:hypothetical protein